MKDILTFTVFLRKYLWSHFLGFFSGFESIKKRIVRLLIVKRGKNTQTFLNTSLLLIFLVIFLIGPSVIANNPFDKQPQVFLPNRDNTLDIEGDTYSLDTSISNIRSAQITYVVEKDETIQSIAEKFGVSENTIRWANNITEDTLQSGQNIIILPVTGVLHTIKPGDSIYSVAKKYHVDPQLIANYPFNDFDDNSFKLITGSSLMVPEGIIESVKSKPVQQIYATAVAGVRGNSNFIWPTDGIITQYPSSYHMALDIANPNSPPVLAADTGTVIYADCIGWGYGCHVIIDHGNGYKTLYGHLWSFQVSAGQVVSQGTVIGTMGSTGRSTGVHLHFEIRSGSSLLNPLGFVSPT